MTTGKLDRELDLFQVSMSLNWLWLHYRNRVSTRFDDDPSSRTVDTDFARALHHFHPYFGSQRHEHPPHSAEALLWHLTNMWTATNFEIIEAAAGRRGRPAAEEALIYLRQHWAGTAAARRTVAHAAQIFAAASRDPACSERSGPFVLYHVGPGAQAPSLLTSVQIFGPFHCGLVLSLYALLQSHHVHDTLSTAPVCRLTDIIDWEKVGLAGMGTASSDPSYAVSRWIMEGACEISSRDAHWNHVSSQAGTVRCTMSPSPRPPVRFSVFSPARPAWMLAQPSLTGTVALDTPRSCGCGPKLYCPCRGEHKSHLNHEGRFSVRSGAGVNVIAGILALPGQEQAALHRQVQCVHTLRHTRASVLS
jgi:hypothetical protein